MDLRQWQWLLQQCCIYYPDWLLHSMGFAWRDTSGYLDGLATMPSIWMDCKTIGDCHLHQLMGDVGMVYMLACAPAVIPFLQVTLTQKETQEMVGDALSEQGLL